MRVAMFVLVAGLMSLLGMGPAESHGDQGTQPPGEGGVKRGAAGKEEREVTRVVLTSPMRHDVIVTQQYVCRINAQRHVEVRAAVTGYLLAIPVKEGQAVKQGEVLFRVDSTIYKARLDAELAEVEVARIEFENTKKLADAARPVVSRQEVALSEAKLAKARAKAAIAKAELDFTSVKAPFDGLVGRLERPQGSLIKLDDTLTTLSDNSVMWVYFSVPEVRYLEYRSREGKPKQISRLELVGSRIELLLANGHKFDPPTSNTVTVESTVNSDTGNIVLRADFPNPDRLLRHGQTGTIRIHHVVKNALVIPQRATFEILDRQYVYVVGKDNVAHQREIVVQRELEDIFVIEKGLDVNDRIVVEGIRQVHEGQKVEFRYVKPQALDKPKTHAE